MEGSDCDVILVCGVCEERTMLGGPLAVWSSESTTFACGCGEQLTLADRRDQGEFEDMTTVARI